MKNFIFNKEQQKLADIILEKNQLMPLSELSVLEIKDLAISWAYYSAKIEGNTYTFSETQTLLKDQITAPKRYEDAQELKNLYNTFISEVEYIKKGGKEMIDERLIFRLHSSFMKDLISDEERGKLRHRKVAITGTNYSPPTNKWEIQQQFSEILYNQEKIENPLERAVYLHCNMARLQPFIDGNKRTSRMLESIVLMNADIVPIFSHKEEDINLYRNALLLFYKNLDYSLYSDYVLNKKSNFLSLKD